MSSSFGQFGFEHFCCRRDRQHVALAEAPSNFSKDATECRSEVCFARRLQDLPRCCVLIGMPDARGCPAATPPAGHRWHVALRINREQGETKICAIKPRESCAKFASSSLFPTLLWRRVSIACATGYIKSPWGPRRMDVKAQGLGHTRGATDGASSPKGGNVRSYNWGSHCGATPPSFLDS